MHHVATALTVYGIETLKYQILNLGAAYERVVTALTVYGIETISLVLERVSVQSYMLQQHLSLTVLKLIKLNAFSLLLFNCCNSSYRLRY